MMLKISRSHPSEKFREIFPSHTPRDWEIMHIICRNYLSPQGDVKWEIEILLKATRDGLDYYEWRIPLPKPEQKVVYGLSVRKGSGELLNYEIKYLKKVSEKFEEDQQDPDFALLKIMFEPLNKGSFINLKLEYFIEKWCEKLKSGIFKSLWKYEWSYRVFSRTHHFEFWVIPPPRSKIIDSESNLTSNEFAYGLQEMVTYKCRNPNVGDLVGKLIYEQETTLSLFAISIIGSTFFSLIFAFLSILAIDLFYKMVFMFFTSFIGIVGLINIAKKLVPTFKF